MTQTAKSQDLSRVVSSAPSQRISSIPFVGGLPAASTPISVSESSGYIKVQYNRTGREFSHVDLAIRRMQIQTSQSATLPRSVLRTTLQQNYQTYLRYMTMWRLNKIVLSVSFSGHIRVIADSLRTRTGSRTDHETRILTTPQSISLQARERQRDCARGYHLSPTESDFHLISLLRMLPR